MRKIIVLFICVVTLVFIYSCNKNKGPVPELPPENSMMLNISDLDTNQTKSLQITKSLDTTSINYIHSGINVLAWNFILSVGLAVPTAAFSESFNHEPIWNEDSNDWIWSYDYQAVLATYSANLHGKVVGDSVEWKMYISRDGVSAFSDFLWYEGKSANNRTGGWWTIYENPTSGKKMLGVIWRENIDETSFIEFKNIRLGDIENGGYINYEETLDLDYNRIYKIYNKGRDNLTHIQWNSETKNGRVQDPFKFSSDTLLTWHCWNQQYKDIDCLH